MKEKDNELAQIKEEQKQFAETEEEQERRPNILPEGTQRKYLNLDAMLDDE